jgi:tetratricopeptide (TPR) repeat protein
MDSATVNLLNMLRNRVQALVDEGNYEEAIHAATAAVEKAQQALSSEYDSVNEFVDALEVRADLLRITGNLDAARADYRQAFDQLDGRLDRLAQAGRLLAGWGAVHDEQGNAERAQACWEKALDIFERLDPPALLDVAAMCNNLAFLRKGAGDFESAEAYFLKALEIDHRELGQDHEETALLCNNLGALYHASGYYEQAREMHLMSLEGRLKTLGADHPDTAQSHNNLALALAMTGDTERATEHFERALTVFEMIERERGGHRDELEAVVANYGEMLRQLGDEAARTAVLARAAATE